MTFERTARGMHKGKVYFRRSPYIVCYWVGTELVLQNYCTGARITAEPITSQVLHFFDRWRSAEALCHRLTEFNAASVRKTVATLARYSFLQCSDVARNAAERALLNWKNWDPPAGFFHFSSKDVQYMSDVAETRRSLRRRAERWPVPSSVKHYPGTRQLGLPPALTQGEFPQVLLSRRTWRRFSAGSMDLEALATLLGLTWGVQRWVPLAGLGRVALKTSPSAGARHPIEVYVLALRVSGLPRGLYHYAPDTHRLELLKVGASSKQAVSYLAGQWFFGSAAALMLMTAVFARSQWKYRDTRAYRTVLFDAGHICQTFCLVATWLGLAPFCTAALADTRVEKALGVDGVRESVLYAAGVGTRPARTDLAPWPSPRST